MKKTVLKTATYTLVFALACIGLVFSVLSLFCPMTMSDVYFKTGSNRLSANYAVVGAERSGKVDDYATAVERLSVAGKNEDLLRLGKKLLSHKSFTAYASYRDGQTAGDGQIAPTGKYADYVATLMVTALYRTGEGDTAIAFAEEADGDAYAVRKELTFLAVTSGDKAFMQKVLDSLLQNPVSDEAYQTDLEILTRLLGAQG